ncbi:BnaC01g35540D [Brassica napus]|uniref:BnaC01g35540D protein n=1 Tax=Brassica napus TaxID=3708 RepID=A0A078G936_BRANA|nr:BnaC01g35540D [Brassica napus]
MILNFLRINFWHFLRSFFGAHLLHPVSSSPFFSIPSIIFFLFSIASHFVLLFSSNVANCKLRRPTSASLRYQDADDDAASFNRRAFVLVCLSLLSSLVSFISGVNETNASKLNQEPEEHPQIYFLNGLGIFSAGVLAALARKDTKTAQATIESVNNQLGDRERALVTKEKDFEARLQLQQEEWNKEREKAQEEQLSLINQLNSAKEVVTGLGRELSSEKILCEELRAQIESLQSSLSKAGEDGKSLETVLRDKLKLIEGLQDRISLLSLELKDKKGEAQRCTSLAEKEAELKKLNSAYAQTRGDLEAEKKSYVQKLDDVTKEYTALQLISEFQSAADAEVISRKEEEIQQMKMLDIELTNVQNLIHELEGAKETLQASRDSVSDLEKLLDESRALCSKFESEVSVFRGEFDEAKERYEEKLAEERGNSEVLARELAVEKDLLKKARDELERLTHELEESSVKNQNLQKELVEIYNTNKKLEEERKTVLALEKEEKAMEKQMLMDREARKSLETDLEEAVSLEDEKEVLQRTLEEANKASKEAKESMEGAYSFLMSLRKEREVLEKKVKKLEEDLGSAKGEILRMRSQPNSKVVKRRKSSTSS